MVNNYSYPLVSIIIPVKNGERTIVRCVESVLALSYPGFELIVINDGSSDGTAALLGRFAGDPRITVIETGGVGPSAARNMGIALANGEFLAFTDGDCIVEPAWLDNLFDEFSNFRAIKVGAVGGCQESPSDDTAFGKTVQQFMKTIGFITDYAKDGRNFDIITATAHNASCNVMYKKEVFKKAGLFLESLWPGEDVELDFRAARAGYTLLFNPKAKVYHYRPATIAQFRRMMQRYGYAQGLLVKKYGFFRPLQYVPVISAVACAAFAIMAVNGLFICVMAACVLIPALILSYFSARTKAPLHHTMLFINTLIFWHYGFYSTVLSDSEL